MMKENEYQLFNQMAMIADLGSGQVKAGFSGEDKPNCVFDSLIGHPKFNQILPMNVEQDVVGPDRDMRGLYRLERPIKRGVLSSENDAKLILTKIYNELKLTNNKETHIFIAEPPFTSNKQKKMLAEVLFENFDAPSIFFGTQGVLSVYAVGKTNGIVLESGEGITQVVPIYNGYKLDYAVEKINFGGEDITQYFKMLLRKNGIHLQSSSENCIVQDMKETVCQLSAQGFKMESKKQNQMTSGMDNKNGESIEYKLPDGESVEIGQERMMAPEILFNPAIAGLEFPGLHEFLNSSIKKLDLDLRKNLYQSILLSGGNTQINGFSDRVAKEIEGLVADQTVVEIVSPNVQKQFLVWQGASTITNVNSFNKLWITKKEFQEEGNRIFLMKTILFITTIKANVNECILGLRIYPFKYVGATQTIEGKFEFKSNCLEFASMNFFILPYDKNYELSKDTHPQRIILSIFGKAFQFDYSEPRKSGTSHNMNIIYQKVRMSPSVITQRISTTQENNLILRTSNGAGFDKEEIETLFYKKNPCLCQLEKNKQTMLCRI